MGIERLGFAAVAEEEDLLQRCDVDFRFLAAGGELKSERGDEEKAQTEEGRVAEGTLSGRLGEGSGHWQW